MPAVDVLEDRLVPAGRMLSSQIGATLTLTAIEDLSAAPSLHDQDITILGLGGRNYSVTGNNGTLVNGGSSANFANVDNITLFLRWGNDVVTVTGANMQTLSFQGGSGNNSLIITSAAASNTFSTVKVVNGDGDDQFLMRGGRTNTITGNLTISNGLGSSVTSLGSGSGDWTIVNGSVQVTNLDGFDQFSFGGDKVQIGRSVLISNGQGGSDTALAASNGPGSNTIGGRLQIVNTAGSDTFRTLGQLVDITGSVAISNGMGPSVSDWNALSHTIYGSVSIVNLDGFDDLDIDAAAAFAVAGSVTIQNGSGGSATEILAAATIGGSLRITNTVGMDAFTNSSAAGPFNVTGAVAIANGTGNSSTMFSRAGTIGGTLSVTNGTGDDTLTIVGGTKADVVINNGAGNTDTDIVSYTTIRNLTIINGTGFDDFRSYQGGLAVSRNLKISNGAGGSSTVFEFDLKSIGGNLTVTALDGINTFFMEQVTVGGNTWIQFGTGADQVEIDASTFLGACTISTGAGRDQVSIETYFPRFEPTTVGGTATINLGAGDDILRIGRSIDDCAVFNGPVSLIGGLDLDTIDAIANGFNQFLSQPFESGWEQGT